MRRNLHAYFWYGFVFSSLSLQAIAASLPAFPANIKLPTLATKNLSNSNRYPDLPDDSFSYSVRYGNPTISATSCMMLAVFAMRELALQDFESSFEGKTWALYSYPDVKVSFTPKSGHTSTVRWALWSLAVAIRDMMVHNRFQTAQFETHYSQAQVGTVKFFVPHGIGAEAGANQTGLAPSLTPAPASATNGTDTILISSSDLEDNPGGLFIQMAFRTIGIPRMDVFMSIVQGLLNLAPKSSTRRITKPLAVIGDALTFNIATSFTSIERSSPPFLRYSHIMLTLAALPRLMLREGKFDEVDVKLLLDDHVIGNGMMRRGPRIGLQALVTANVSVS